MSLQELHDSIAPSMMHTQNRQKGEKVEYLVRENDPCKENNDLEVESR